MKYPKPRNKSELDTIRILEQRDGLQHRIDAAKHKLRFYIAGENSEGRHVEKSLIDVEEILTEIDDAELQTEVGKNGEANAEPTQTIDVIVEGGVIQNILNVPSGVQVRVIDYDTDGADPERIDKSPYDGEDCFLSTYDNTQTELNTLNESKTQ